MELGFTKEIAFISYPVHKPSILQSLQIIRTTLTTILISQILVGISTLILCPFEIIVHVVRRSAFLAD